MTPNSEDEYEDLLAEWSDLESGLGIILANPDSTQQFAHRVLQYDRWMQGLMQRDPDVGLYLLFQLASNSPVGYSASHALVCAVLCHLIASELVIAQKERDSLVRAALTMNIAGVVKDWMLIYLSWVIFAGPITALNLIGYSIAFGAVCWYNYIKLKAMSADNAKKEGEKLEAVEDAEAGDKAAPPLSLPPAEKELKE